MENFEILLENNLSEIKPVVFNYEQLKGNVLNILNNYQDVAYSDSTIALAKEDRATLNKIAKYLNSERLRLEREYLKPFEDFKNKITELVKLAQKTSDDIDVQVKEFEAKEKEIAKQKVTEIINELNKDIPFNVLFEERYLLKSVSEKQIQDSVSVKISKILEDLEIINMHEPVDLCDITKYYYQTNCSLSTTLIELKRIKEIANKVKEDVKETFEKPIEQKKENEEVKEFNLTLFCTDNQFKQIKEFLKINGIRGI